MNTTQKGTEFELYVVRLFKDLGKHNIKHDQKKKKKRFRKESLNFQIDLTYGILKKYYVECKYKTKGNVGLEEVAKFQSVLSILKIPTKQGIMVTNQNYTARAEYYAVKQEITIYNRKDLLKLDKKSRGLEAKLL
jgi:hypothetical protein